MDILAGATAVKTLCPDALAVAPVGEFVAGDDVGVGVDGFQDVQGLFFDPVSAGPDGEPGPPGA